MARRRPKAGGTVLHESDVFMQWVGVQCTTGAASNTLVETELPTGMSARGQYAWAIHVVEIDYQGLYVLDAVSNRWDWALSTRQGLATMPEIDETGCVMAQRRHNAIWTAVGNAEIDTPFVWKCLPPTLIATSKLSMYFQTAIDDAAHQSRNHEFRIGYTTVPLDSANMWLEIAETWGAGL